jgi:concanavalin A-like lectin/glucanase superfamily protein
MRPVRIHVVGIRTALSTVVTGCAVLVLAPVAAAAAGTAGQVTLRPAAGAAGTPVVLEGAGFPASAPVRVGVAGRPARTVRSSGSGAFTARLTVPSARRGVVAIVARGGRTRVVSRFLVRAGRGAAPVVEVASSLRGRIRAAPSALVPGGTLVLRGTDLAPRRRLAVSWIGARRTVTTTGDGGFTAAIAVPVAQAAGRWPGLLVGAGTRLAFRLDVLAKAAAGSPPTGATGSPPAGGAGTPVTAAGAPSPRSGPPVSFSPPTIAGVATIGSTLTAAPGVWTGTAPMTFAYAWRRCDASGAACTAISGATSSTRVVAAGDAGRTLRVTVTARNAPGSATATSAGTALVPPPPPTGGVVALWHMDETSGTVMSDAVGGHNGTLSGVAVGVTPGFAGTAYRFSGSSFVSVPSAAALNPGAANITVTIHLKTTSTPATPDWDLIRKGLFTTVGGEFKVEYQPSGQASCGFAGSGGSNELITGPALNDGAWHTVQCTKTPSSISLVVDGRTFSQAGAVGSISNDAPVVVGARPGSEFFQGSLDEASIRIG